MAVDFTKPVTGDNYTALLSQLVANLTGLGQLLDSSLVTFTGTIPTGIKRLSAATGLLEVYNGTSWATHTVGYAKKSGDTFTGNIVIATPSSGVPLIVNSIAASIANVWTDGTVSGQVAFGSTQMNIGTTSAHPVTLATAGAVRLSINSAGNVVLNAPSSGTSLLVDGSGAVFSTGGYNYATISTIVSSVDAVFGAGIIADLANAQQFKKTVPDMAHGILMQISDGISFHTGFTGATGTSFPRAANRRMQITPVGNVVINSPTSGVSLTVIQNGSTQGIQVVASAGNYAAIQLSDGNTGGHSWFAMSGGYTAGCFSLYDATVGAHRLIINTIGNFIMPAPTSGSTLATTSANGGYAISLASTAGADGRTVMSFNNGAKDWSIGINAAGGSDKQFNIRDVTRSVDVLSLSTIGNATFSAPTSGNTLNLIALPGNYWLQGTDGTAIFNAYSNGASGVALGTATNHPLILYSNGYSNPRISISGTGNISINTPSSGTSLSVGVVLGGTAQVWNDSVVEGGVLTAGAALGIGSFTGHPLKLLTGGATRVDISSAGNVVITTPVSGSTLQLSAVSNGVFLTAVDGTNTFFADFAGASHGVRFGTITNSNFDILTNSTLRIGISGTGNIVVSAPSSGAAIAITGVANTAAITASTGISFGNSANTTTNVLDWYEEGTFTPTASFGTTVAAVTYSDQSGVFTRIGNIVYYSIVMQWTGGDNTTLLSINGLPYICALTAPCSMHAQAGLTWSGHLTPYVNSGAQSVTLFTSVTGTSGTFPSQSAAGTKSIRISGFYRAA